MARRHSGSCAKRASADDRADERLRPPCGCVRRSRRDLGIHRARQRRGRRPGSCGHPSDPHDARGIASDWTSAPGSDDPPVTIPCSFGDIVLVPFPFTDQTASKTRPAVVVSADAYHQQRPDVILIAVPSQILRPAGSVGDVLIADWHGLFKVTMFSPFARPCRRFSARASWLGHLTSGDVAYAQCASALVNT